MNMYYHFGSRILICIAALFFTNCRDNATGNNSDIVSPLADSSSLPGSAILKGYLINHTESMTDLAGIKIYLLSDIEKLYDTNNIRHALYTTNSFSDGYYFFKNIDAGSYVLSAWLDADNSNNINSGDISGIYGAGIYPDVTAEYISLRKGDTLRIDFNIYSLP